MTQGAEAVALTLPMDAVCLAAVGNGTCAHYVAVAVAGVLGTFFYAVSAFGRAIVFHMAWSILALMLPLHATLLDLVLLITLQGVRLALEREVLPA